MGTHRHPGFVALFLAALIAPLLGTGLLMSCATTPRGGDGKADAVSSASGPAEAAAPGRKIADDIAPVQGGKILVVYYSQGAATTRVAEDLAALSGADIERVVETKPRRMNFLGFMNAGRQASFHAPSRIEEPAREPSAYDAVAVLTPVWSWNLSPPMRAWLRLMKGKLPGRVVFATISGDTKPDKIVAAMEKESGAKAKAFAGFSERDFLPENRAGYVEKVARLADGLRL